MKQDVILPDNIGADPTRMAWLVRHVTEAADELKRLQLPGEDQPLSVFRKDLEKEAYNGH